MHIISSLVKSFSKSFSFITHVLLVENARYLFQFLFVFFAFLHALPNYISDSTTIFFVCSRVHFKELFFFLSLNFEVYFSPIPFAIASIKLLFLVL